MLRLWKACDAQVGDDFHINPEEIESKYFGVLAKLSCCKFASGFDVNTSLDSVQRLASRRQVDFVRIQAHEQIKAGKFVLHHQNLKTFGTGIPSHWLEMSKSRLYDGD